MIRDKSENTEKPIIDLTGPDGNAFALMGYARRWFNELKDFLLFQLKFADQEVSAKTIIEEMMSGDYENLLQVLEKYFGEYVIFER